ncbi:MAG: hypothetical protein RLZZ26_495 [Candidatus Parcubacteria bacterium]|jgi:diguanylate cyclase
MEFPGGTRRYGEGASKDDLRKDLDELSELHVDTERRNFHDAVHAEHLHSLEPLTGLKTRPVFDRALDKELKLIRGEIQEKRVNKEVSFMLIDLDHFKKVNDTFGHRAGDAVLQKVAKILMESGRSTDTVARWGGEELVMLMPGASVAVAAQHAEAIRSEIESTSFTEYPGLKITASIGVISSAVSTLEAELLEKVDKALYKAKGAGRNRIEVVYKDGPETKAI